MKPAGRVYRRAPSVWNMFVCVGNFQGNVCSATLPVLTPRPTSHKLSLTERREGGKNVSFLPGWRCWMRMAVGGRQREKNTRRKSSISVWVQYLWPHWLRVKLLSLVQLKQVEAGSSPLQIHQALVSVRLPPIHQVASLSEKKPH